MRLLLICSILLASCNWIQDKAKDTAKAGGEMAGEVAGEFIEAVHDGVEEVVSPALEMHEDIESLGIEVGEYHMAGSPFKNKLEVYLISNRDVEVALRFFVKNSEGKEVGRSQLNFSGQAGDAGYHEVQFDERTHIESSSTVRMELVK